MAQIERPANSVKLFVGQIPKSYTEDDLQNLLAPFGSIFELSILRDKATQNSRGCAFVTFLSKEEADVAIQNLHGNKVLPGMNFPIQVKYADSELEKQEHKLFVGMLPKSATEEQLRQIFAVYGTIEELTIIRKQQTNESKGFGFVKFVKREHAQNAINCLNGIFQMEGSNQKMVVKFADTSRDKEKKKQQQATLLQQQLMLQAGFFGLPGMNMNTLAMSPAMAALASNPAAVASLNPSLNALSSAMGVSQMMNPSLAAQTQSSVLASPAAALGVGAPYLQNQSAQTAAYYGAAPAAQTGPTGQTQGPPGANLFIYHLPQWFTDRDLYVNFSPFGTVISAKVFVDKLTGQSKCFGFVSFDNADSAQAAIQSMNGFQIGDKRLRVAIKRGKDESSPY